MRRTDREITDFQKMMQILAECDCCRLGLIDEKGAYIVPLNFGYEEADGKLSFYFHGASSGKKIDLLKQNPFVSFEMDRKHQLVEGDLPCAYSYRYQSIMGNGKVQFLDRYEEKVNALNALMSHYSKKERWEFPREHVDAITVLKMEVIDWSCKEH